MISSSSGLRECQTLRLGPVPDVEGGIVGAFHGEVGSGGDKGVHILPHDILISMNLEHQPCTTAVYMIAGYITRHTMPTPKLMAVTRQSEHNTAFHPLRHFRTNDLAPFPAGREELKEKTDAIFMAHCAEILVCCSAFSRGEPEADRRALILGGILAQQRLKTHDGFLSQS